MSHTSTTLSRRELMRTMGVAAGAVALAPGLAMAQAAGTPAAPPTTITNPPRDFGPGGAPTTYFTDPDVLTIEPSSTVCATNTSIVRLGTGAWSEDRPGAARAAISCGATSRTTVSCAGWRTTAG
jgi:gluconolactonase